MTAECEVDADCTAGTTTPFTNGRAETTPAVAAAVVRGAWVAAVEGDRFAADDLLANVTASGAQVNTTKGSVEQFVAGCARFSQMQCR